MLGASPSNRIAEYRHRDHFVPVIPAIVRQYIDNYMGGVRADLQQREGGHTASLLSKNSNCPLALASVSSIQLILQL